MSAAFCLMQDSPVDKAMYYDAYPARAYCGLYHFPGARTTQTYSAFAMWNRLYRLGGHCAARSDGTKLYTCAAADRTGKAWFITNFNGESRSVTLDLKGAQLKEFTARIIDRRHDNAPFALSKQIVMPPYSTLLLTTFEDEPGKAAKPARKTAAVHAGLDDTTVKKGKKK